MVRIENEHELPVRPLERVVQVAGLRIGLGQTFGRTGQVLDAQLLGSRTHRVGVLLVQHVDAQEAVPFELGCRLDRPLHDPHRLAAHGDVDIDTGLLLDR
jgi:hypothetical protein